MKRFLKEFAKDVIPDSLLLGQLVLRRAPVWESRGIIFLHVPKNGGTSLNTALFGKFMGHFRVIDIERLRPNLLSKLPSLAVTRNPWARTFSAYKFAKSGATMTDGPQIRNIQRYSEPSFSTFERFVLDWLPQRKLSKEDYVFRPQVDFIRNKKGQIGVKHLGQIEEPASYLPYLEEVLGRPIEVGRLNSTTRSDSYRRQYSQEMKDVIANIYLEDLKAFPYDF